MIEQEREITYKKNRVEQMLKPNPEGVCRICKSYGKLSADHVPPKCLGNNGKVSLRLGGKVQTRQAGIKFKTLCSKCNSLLGIKYDKDFGVLYNDMQYIKHNQYKVYGKFHGIKIVPNNLLRSFCGHMLAIWFSDNPEDEIAVQPNNLKLTNSMRQFVLGEISEISYLSFYFWFYPYEEAQINQYWGKLVSDDLGKFHNIYGTTMKTFPIAIWMVDNRNSTALPNFLKSLPQTNDEILLKIKLDKVHDKEWPEMDNNGISLMSLDSKFDYLK